MTLPFRRRHHDSEASHDRARMLMSDGLLVELSTEDAAWLGRHLDGCAECGRDWKAFRADRKLLRTLRTQPIEPPRDLWARTAAALDREAERHGVPAGARARGARRGGGWRALPLGAISSVAVLAVVIGALLWRPIVPPAPSQGTAPPVAVATTPAATSVLLPEAEPIAIFRQTAAGSWELVYSDVTEVCPSSNRSCVPKPRGEVQEVEIGDAPSQIALSGDQLVVASDPTAGSPGMVLVFSVEEPGESPAPTVFVTEPPVTTPPDGSPAPATPTPFPTPPGSMAIATGVSVVGDVAYSEDGRWVAFSARPTDDDSTGPDLYLWEVGQPMAAAITNDHQTYFSSWHDGKILASRVEIPGAAGPTPSTEPGASAEPDETDKPGRDNGNGGSQGGKGRSTPSPTVEPTPSAAAASATPNASGSTEVIEGRPISFLLDPATLARTDLTQPDVWLPVIDPRGRSVAYWSGTLRSEDDGLTWALGSGELALDRWSSDGERIGVQPSAGPGGDRNGGGKPTASPSPDPSAPVLGPIGARTILVPGVKAAFEARFDPAGERLAIWVGETLDEKVGRLHLLVIDPETGEVSTDSPLQGAPALRRFALDKGRLAWVTPRGQDGDESAVQVLGWKGHDFGEIRTEPGSDLYLP